MSDLIRLDLSHRQTGPALSVDIDPRRLESLVPGADPVRLLFAGLAALLEAEAGAARRHDRTGALLARIAGLREPLFLHPGLRLHPGSLSGRQPGPARGLSAVTDGASLQIEGEGPLPLALFLPRQIATRSAALSSSEGMLRMQRLAFARTLSGTPARHSSCLALAACGPFLSSPYETDLSAYARPIVLLGAPGPGTGAGSADIAQSLQVLLRSLHGLFLAGPAHPGEDGRWTTWPALDDILAPGPLEAWRRLVADCSDAIDAAAPLVARTLSCRQAVFSAHEHVLFAAAMRRLSRQAGEACPTPMEYKA